MRYGYIIRINEEILTSDSGVHPCMGNRYLVFTSKRLAQKYKTYEFGRQVRDVKIEKIPMGVW